MERLTKRNGDGKGYIPCHWKESAEAVDKGQNRLADIEDILGDNYDLSRLRELVQADREGRCVVLPVKPGGFVRFAGNSRAKHEKVDAISIYAGGRITFAFHETGMKTRWVDEWSEDESERYVSVESDEAALKEQENK